MAIVRIGVQHKDATVPAKVGDTVEVVLPETATTGFQWQADEPGPALAVETSKLEPPDVASPGAGGTRHVVVRAVEPGTSRLSLRLRRSWEPPEKSEDTYAVDIDVT
jgi:inhibitor of cysteine peptidase